MDVFARDKIGMMSYLNNMSRVMTKPDFCLSENKDADQLHINCEDDQRLW